MSFSITVEGKTTNEVKSELLKFADMIGIETDVKQITTFSTEGVKTSKQEMMVEEAPLHIQEHIAITDPVDDMMPGDSNPKPTPMQVPAPAVEDPKPKAKKAAKKKTKKKVTATVDDDSHEALMDWAQQVAKSEIGVQGAIKIVKDICDKGNLSAVPDDKRAEVIAAFKLCLED